MYSDIAQWARIRRQVLIGGNSQREVAEKNGITRATVRKMVRSPLPLGYRRCAPYPRSKLGQWLEVLDRIIAEDADKPIKQRRTAKEIWQQLRTDHGFDGGQTTVKDQIRAVRNGSKNRPQLRCSSAKSINPSDRPLTPAGLALAIYDGILSIPKRQAIKFLSCLYSSNSSQIALEMLRRVLPSPLRTMAESRKRQDALNWIWRIVQGKTSSQSLAEEIGDSPDLKDLLNVACHGRLAVRSRALVILGTKKGLSMRRLSDLLCLSRATVGKHWLSYRQSGWQPPIVSQRKSNAKIDKYSNKQAVFSLLHSPPSLHGFNRTTWRMADLQSVLQRQGQSMCKDVIHTIIKDAGFRWRKARIVLTSHDPDYREKVEAIKDILSRLTPDEAFFSVDEFGPFAVKRKGGKKRVAHGEDYVVPQWQKSKGWLILTAALELTRNQVTHFYSLKKNTEEMIRMADLLKTQYSQCKTLYLSWDAASWHISKKLIAHLDKLNQQAARYGGPIVKTAPLPAGAQFLNIIESVFSGMAKAIIHNSDYLSVEAAKGAIDRHFAERNTQFLNHPKRAGDKIWRQERVTSEFREGQNCKDPLY